MLAHSIDAELTAGGAPRAHNARWEAKEGKEKEPRRRGGQKEEKAEKNSKTHRKASAHMRGRFFT